MKYAEAMKMRPGETVFIVLEGHPVPYQINQMRPYVGVGGARSILLDLCAQWGDTVSGITMEDVYMDYRSALGSVYDARIDALKSVQLRTHEYERTHSS